MQCFLLFFFCFFQITNILETYFLISAQASLRQLDKKDCLDINERSQHVAYLGKNFSTDIFIKGLRAVTKGSKYKLPFPFL